MLFAHCVDTSVFSEQMIRFLASDHEAIKELCLRVIARLVSAPEAYQMLLQDGDLLDGVIAMSMNAVDDDVSPAVQVVALQIVDKVC